MVYVVQDRADKNITPALAYGKFRFILDPNTTTNMPARIIWQLQNGLNEFTSEDHLLLIGDPLLIGLTTAMAIKNVKGDSIRLLKWDRQEKCYLEVVIEVKHLR